MTQGVVKVYDPESGFGIIVVDEDQSEVMLQPGSLDGSVFRTLRQGQRLIFDVQDEAGRAVAARLRLGSDGY